MAKRRPSGDGMVRKREDGRWEGRIVVGHKENGDYIFRYVYADTQKELTTKLRQNIDAYQGVDPDGGEQNDAVRVAGPVAGADVTHPAARHPETVPRRHRPPCQTPPGAEEAHATHR